MEGTNETVVSEFILLGFSTIDDHLQAFIFLLLFFMYLVTLLGNALAIFIVWVDHRLHTPMYFFFSNFSFLEILFTSVTNPKMLLNFITSRRTISFPMCIAQSYFYFAVGAIEFAILAVMSSDHYVAICFPLQYVTIMRPSLCVQRVLGSWVGGFSVISLHMILISKLRFSGPSVIHHFFCDSTPLFQLLFVDIHLIKNVDAMLLSTIVFSSMCLTMVSYFCILFSMLRIPSSPERKKGFTTCTSHLTVVMLTFGGCIFMYARPVPGHTLDLNKGMAVLNTILTLFLNPFVYTFQNKKVKLTLRDAISENCKAVSYILTFIVFHAETRRSQE